MDETARQSEVKAVEMYYYSDGHLTQFFIFNMPRLFREAIEHETQYLCRTFSLNG